MHYIIRIDMLRYRLVFILTISLIFSGCQFSQFAKNFNISNPPAESTDSTETVGLDTQTTDMQNPTNPTQVDPKESVVQDANTEDNQNQTADGTAEAENIAPEINKGSVEPVNPSDAVAQEKIDQALELCNYAQQMWEKGKIEEALTSLDSAYYSILEIEQDAPEHYTQQKEDIRYLISKRILEIYASRQIVITGQHDEIPVTLNKYVEKEIKRLTGRDKRYFIKALERSQKYRPFMVEELRKAGLPEELSWLPMIESSFKVRALSPARALGLWQFIPSTGHKFGLNRNYYIDERLDPEKSTKAAISYLKELHKLFGDWTTALAAYNCGEYRVLRIIRKQRINYLDNFWDLHQSLPRETSRYVPKFLATLHVINNLEKYGITVKESAPSIEYATCDIKKQVRLRDIAKEIGVSTTTLKELNPELRYSLLPPELYKLRVPADKAELFISKIDAIRSTYSPPPMYVYHRVRRGETLSEIAEKYKSSIRSISRVNNISRYRIYAGKVLKIPSRKNRAPVNNIAVKKIPPGKTITYNVRRGDSLWIIARKFGTTTKHIMAINNLTDARLDIGQTLYISNSKKAAGPKLGSSTYQVRSGDSCFLIAKRHNMTLNRLLALNSLSKGSKIFPGQTLIVE